MRLGILGLWLCLLLAGCDAVDALRGASGEAEVQADAEAGEARPAGWESLDGEGRATRLYYQFVDARGQVRFVERLEDVPDDWRERVGFVKMETPPPLSPGDASRARAAQAKRSGAVRVASRADERPPVVLYSATWCGACRRAKRYLDERGVDYEIRDVDDPRHASELLRRTGQRAIPVLDVGGRILTGFDARRYDALIGRA